MKRLILATIALALSACTGLAPSTTAGSTPSPIAAAVAKADTVILTGERAFAVAELGYITAAKGVGIAVDAGLSTGATATWVRARNVEARSLLVKGRATADIAEKARIAARLFGITDSLNATTGSN